MAKSGLAPRQVKLRIKPVVKASRTAISRAFDRVAKEMQRSLRRKISKPSPPVSRPGSPPHKRSGYLHDHTTVGRKGYELRVRVPTYGIFLEGGTRKMRARPFIRKTIHAKRREWSKKITKYAKAAMK